MNVTGWVALMTALLLFGVVVGLVREVMSLRVVARPDQWLLHIRNGEMLSAGVGVSCWRRPGDVAVLFSSTLQRVRFTVSALSRDRVQVIVEGFILWSVDEEGDGPFRAFRQMGLIDLGEQSSEMRSRKHLLTTPQHRAFRTLLSAEVQRHAATLTLNDLLLRQDALVEGLGRRLAPLSSDLGIRIDQVEVVQARAEDASLMNDLASEKLEAVREEAARVRQDAAERLSQHTLARDTRLAAERAEAGRVNKLRALEVAQEVARQKHGQEVELAKLRDEAEAQRALVRRQREAQELEARLSAMRLEAEAARDAAMIRAEADEAKSDGVREHELRRQTIEQVGAALAKSPIKDARWISVGQESPLTSLAGLFSALQPSEPPKA